jgi:hypothetical protein
MFAHALVLSAFRRGHLTRAHAEARAKKRARRITYASTSYFHHLLCYGAKASLHASVAYSDLLYASPDTLLYLVHRCPKVL